MKFVATQTERDNMIRKNLINILTNKAIALQNEGKWEAADRFLILALRIGG